MLRRCETLSFPAGALAAIGTVDIDDRWRRRLPVCKRGR